MKKTPTYHVDYERDESGHWIATVRGVAGCHTYGRSIEETRRRVREALATAVDDAETAALADHVKLPKAIERDLARARRLRRAVEERQAEAGAAARKAVRALLSDMGVSVRDAGALLGVSGQRVHELAKEEA
jgi:predicted RNase H-like HicB family nuclease